MPIIMDRISSGFNDSRAPLAARIASALGAAALGLGAGMPMIPIWGRALRPFPLLPSKLLPHPPSLAPVTVQAPTQSAPLSPDAGNRRCHGQCASTGSTSEQAAAMVANASPRSNRLPAWATNARDRHGCKRATSFPPGPPVGPAASTANHGIISCVAVRIWRTLVFAKVPDHQVWQRGWGGSDL